MSEQAKTQADCRAPRLRANAEDADVICADGDWTQPHAPNLAAAIAHQAGDGRPGRIDAGGITRLDASGAMLLIRLLEQSELDGERLSLPENWQALFDAVQESLQRKPELEPEPEAQWRQLLAQIGRTVVEVATSTTQLVSFLGQTLHRLARTLVQPARLRVTATVHHMQQTGLDAIPLLILLSALVGAVVAYLGATVLQDFGAELLVIDLVTFAFLREFGVLLTAILLAGRTASAFCAQIGMMKSREEIDAIRTLGLDAMELLVLPRLIALLIMLPLLAFIATLAGLFGGFVVSVTSLDLGASLFIDRVYQTVTLKHFVVGLLKAPIFAIIIALIGCFEGLRVAGTAQSVGEHTTTAVVRSLTMVIVVDALAAIYFMEMGW
ncbi:MAG: MlaE family lipid ABC transporter permease subunit [Xanthomonadaceae bacterium]|nr:MlaE family lipid ABC transporter permease subunit [Xanthomonadaceae bacterium]